MCLIQVLLSLIGMYLLLHIIPRRYPKTIAAFVAWLCFVVGVSAIGYIYTKVFELF